MLSAARAEKADATLIAKASTVISVRFVWFAGMTPVAAIRAPVANAATRYHALLVSVVSTSGPPITFKTWGKRAQTPNKAMASTPTPAVANR